MIRLLSPGLLALALLASAGCGECPAPEPLVVISGPKAFHSFALRDEADRVIWSLAADPPAPVSELVYGRVPQGFRQETPAEGGRPRALVVGELLRLESVTPRRIFKHEGWVARDQRLSIEHWEMILRHRGEPELDVPPASP